MLRMLQAEKIFKVHPEGETIALCNLAEPTLLSQLVAYNEHGVQLHPEEISLSHNGATEKLRVVQFPPVIDGGVELTIDQNGFLVLESQSQTFPPGTLFLVGKTSVNYRLLTAWKTGFDKLQLVVEKKLLQKDVFPVQEKRQKLIDSLSHTNYESAFWQLLRKLTQE